MGHSATAELVVVRHGETTSMPGIGDTASAGMQDPVRRVLTDNPRPLQNRGQVQIVNTCEK